MVKGDGLDAETYGVDARRVLRALRVPHVHRGRVHLRGGDAEEGVERRDEATACERCRSVRVRLGLEKRVDRHRRCRGRVHRGVVRGGGGVHGVADGRERRRPGVQQRSKRPSDIAEGRPRSAEVLP